MLVFDLVLAMLTIALGENTCEDRVGGKVKWN